MNIDSMQLGREKIALPCQLLIYSQEPGVFNFVLHWEHQSSKCRVYKHYVEAYTVLPALKPGSLRPSASNVVACFSMWRGRALHGSSTYPLQALNFVHIRPTESGGAWNRFLSSCLNGFVWYRLNLRYWYLTKHTQWITHFRVQLGQ